MSLASKSEIWKNSEGAGGGPKSLWDNYHSCFSWRYGTEEMRTIWSENHKRRIWRKIWTLIAEFQKGLGLVTDEQFSDLQKNAENIDVERSLQIESQNHHDLMAELLTFAEQCKVGGGIIHIGATSLDVEDNAEVVRCLESLGILHKKLKAVIGKLAELTERWSDLPVLGWTHLQPAEPTTFGYRLSIYLYDLLDDLEAIETLTKTIGGKGIRGAVGTSASFMELTSRELSAESAIELESHVMRGLNLTSVPVSNQTYPRKQDWKLINVLSGISLSLYRMSFDFRILSMPPNDEISITRHASEVSSSAMPFKRNPVDCETVCSLGRFVSNIQNVAWSNAAHALLERTLDDAANRNEFLPSCFLATDESLSRTVRILDQLEVHPNAIKANLNSHSVRAATERILMAAVRSGGDRQEIYEKLRRYCQEAPSDGGSSGLLQLLKSDRLLRELIGDNLEVLLNVENYVGLAPERARALAHSAKLKIKSKQSEAA